MYLKNPRESMIKLTQTLKVEGYKITTQKLIPFTCTHNNQLEEIINSTSNSNKEEILRNKLNSKCVKPIRIKYENTFGKTQK